MTKQYTELFIYLCIVNIKKRRYIQLALAAIAMLIILFTMVLNSPRVQQRISVILATELENHIGTRVQLGGVHWLFPNDIIIEDLEIDDQEGEHLFAVKRIAAKVEWAPLLKDRQISIRNIRFFYPDVMLYKEAEAESYNYQFLIDAFSSKREKERKPSQFTLRVNSLLIRHANFIHRIGLPDNQNLNSSSLLSFNNINIKNFSTHLSLKTLSSDSLSLMVRQLSFTEQSGFKVNNLYLRLVGNKQGATLANFQLEMPHSILELDTIWASYTPDNFAKSLIVKGKISPSYITPADLRSLWPVMSLCTEKFHLTANFITNTSRVILKEFDTHTTHRDIHIQAKGTANFSKKEGHTIDIELQKAAITQQAWSLLEKHYPQFHTLVPPEVIRIGNISAHGNAHLKNRAGDIHLQTHTDAGNFQAHIDIDKEGNYTAVAEGQDINIAHIVPKSPITHTDVSVITQGTYSPDTHNHTMPFTGTINATATDTRFLGYSYNAIIFEGRYSPELYEGNVSIDDPNGKLTVQASYTSTEAKHTCNIDIEADSLNLYAMKIIGIHPDATFSTHLHADVQGYNLEQLTGEVSLNNLTMHRDTGDYLIKRVTVYSSDPEKKMLSVQSDFMNGSLSGSFTYQSLANMLLKQLHNYLPSLCRSHSHNHTTSGSSLCNASFTIHDTKPLRELLNIPVNIDKEVDIRAIINEYTHNINFTASIPQIEYNGNVFKGINIACYSQGDMLDFHMGGMLQNDEKTSIAGNLKVNAQNDKLSVKAGWNSEPSGLFEGSFTAGARFGLTDHGELIISAKSDSARAIINKSIWVLNPFRIDIDPLQIDIQNLHFANGRDQHLSINGAIANNSSDTLQVELHNIDLGYLLSLAKLKGISFDGNVNGYLNAANLFSSSPHMDAHLTTQDFTFCGGAMGDLEARAHWDQDSTRLNFQGHINEVPHRTTSINGHVDIEKNKLQLDITADSTNISFLNSMLSSFLDNVKGNASGHITLGGHMDSLDISGALMTDASFNLSPTHVKYRIRDSIRFTPGAIHFNNINALDKHNRTATINGIVTHANLNEYAYDLKINAKNILGIDLPNTGNDNFYTTIYGTGDIHVMGAPNTPLSINIQAHPERGSRFALNLMNQTVSSSEAFITFIDRSSKRNTPTIATRLPERRRSTTSETTTLNLDITTSVTPDATLKLVMDQNTDDHISVTGSGDLQISVQGEEVNLFGTYMVNRGFYRLNLQDFFSKNFEVLSGSTVTFDGDPMAARLNITARHAVNYVPMRDLNPESSGDVHVNCLLLIGGTLNSPTLKFDIELPQGTEEEKSILRSYTTTEEQMNMQFIYLLGLGKFYTSDIAQNPEGTSNMESFLSSTISGQLNNLLSNIISNENWNFASNIRTDNMLTENAEEGWSNMEIEGILEGRMLNNRLLINGNFGYRDNPMYASNFIGDFDVRYMLTNDISFKGYNKTNDRYFTKTSLTTQGVGIIFQKDFDYLFPRFKVRKANNSTDTESAIITAIDTTNAEKTPPPQ